MRTFQKETSLCKTDSVPPNCFKEKSRLGCASAMEAGATGETWRVLLGVQQLFPFYESVFLQWGIGSEVPHFVKCFVSQDWQEPGSGFCPEALINALSVNIILISKLCMSSRIPCLIKLALQNWVTFFFFFFECAIIQLFGFFLVKSLCTWAQI